VWRNGATSHALALAGILAPGRSFSLFLSFTLAEKTEEAGNRRGSWEDILIKKLLASLTTRDFSVLIVASALTGQLAWFSLGAAIAPRCWLSLAWLLFRAGRFAWVRRVWEEKKYEKNTFVVLGCSGSLVTALFAFMTFPVWAMRKERLPSMNHHSMTTGEGTNPPADSTSPMTP